MATAAKQSSANDDPIDTVAASKVLGVPAQTLRLWRHEQREDQPPFLRMPNGRIRYQPSKLKQWLASREQTY